jgi:hypothetical protein
MTERSMKWAATQSILEAPVDRHAQGCDHHKYLKHPQHQPLKTVGVCLCVRLLALALHLADSLCAAWMIFDLRYTTAPPTFGNL